MKETARALLLYSSRLSRAFFLILNWFMVIVLSTFLYMSERSTSEDSSAAIVKVLGRTFLWAKPPVSVSNPTARGRAKSSSILTFISFIKLYIISQQAG